MTSSTAAEAFVRIIDEAYEDIGLLHYAHIDDSGQPVLCSPGEHIVVLEHRLRRPRNAFDSPLYEVRRVSMGSLSSASVITVASGLDRGVAVVLARALNARAGIEPEPDSPIGLLEREIAELSARSADLDAERQRVLARIAEEQDSIELRTGQLQHRLDELIAGRSDR